MLVLYSVPTGEAIGRPPANGLPPLVVWQAVLSGLCVGGAYALVALGFSVTFTTTKTLNFSHGEFVSAGAFVGMSVLFLALGVGERIAETNRLRLLAQLRQQGGLVDRG